MAGYDGMWVPPDQDPRMQTPQPIGERDTLLQYLNHYRTTFAYKCEGLDAEQIARRSVPPSTMSLLGLLRHLAKVEHHWFRRVMEHQWDLPRLFFSPDEADLDFNGAAPDDAVVSEAWAAWRAEVAHADAYLATDPSMDTEGYHPDGPAPLRDVLVHMIEEYARHCGHADLLRECIDGRTGQ